VRYRRFGKSELEVSEVGFGVWTLASDWWGRVDDPRGMLHALRNKENPYNQDVMGVSASLYRNVEHRRESADLVKLTRA